MARATSSSNASQPSSSRASGMSSRTRSAICWSKAASLSDWLSSVVRKAVVELMQSPSLGLLSRTCVLATSAQLETTVSSDEIGAEGSTAANEGNTAAIAKDSPNTTCFILHLSLARRAKEPTQHLSTNY